MHNPGRVKTFTADGAIAAKRIVTIAADYVVSQAEEASMANIGVTELSCEDGAPVDVLTDGIVEVEAAEAITAGDCVTADEDGKAVVAEDTDAVFGIAIDSASADEYVPVMIRQSRGAAAAGEGG